MCSKNGGLFIKVGQHVGALQYLLPREYVQTFKVFHSEAPSTPLPRMKQVIEQDLGRPGLIWLLVRYSQVIVRTMISFLSDSVMTDLPPLWRLVDEIFSELDEEPLGAASLAQCHRGVLKEDGRVVAVKIQHPDVGKNAYTDMDTMDVSGVLLRHS